MSSKKASLTNAELELTQKIQMHFPRGLPEGKIQICNSISVDVLNKQLLEMIDGLVSSLDIIVVSDGQCGEEVIARMEGKGFRIGSDAKSVISGPKFTVTNNISYQIGILHSDEIPLKSQYYYHRTNDIRNEARRRGWITPPLEIAHLLREKLTDKELEKMGHYKFVIMHDPIINFDQDNVEKGVKFLSLDRGGGGRWLDMFYNVDRGFWEREYGFVFIIPRK